MKSTLQHLDCLLKERNESHALRIWNLNYSMIQTNRQGIIVNTRDDGLAIPVINVSSIYTRHIIWKTKTNMIDAIVKRIAR